MKLKKFLVLNIVIAILISSSIILLSEKGFFKRMELGGLDFLLRLRGPSPYNPHIVVIEIDDENISKIGRWPWPRKWHAALIEALKDFGAKYIYFDILFSEDSSKEDDWALSKAIKSAGNVYLPFAFLERSVDIKTALLPIKEFSPYIRGKGSVNIYPDIDGSLRKVPLLFVGEKGIYPHVALKIAMDYSKSRLKEISSNYLILSRGDERIKIPLVEKNEMLINWLGGWKETFKHYSFMNVLNAHSDFLENEKPKIDLKPFKDSICLIAITAIGLYDIKPIPLEPEYPAAGVIATTISNILDKKFITPSPRWLNWLLIYMLSLVPSLFISGEGPLKETLFVALFAIVFFFLSIVLFKNNLWLNFSLPLFSLTTSYLLVATYNFIHISVERKSFFNLAVTDGLTGLYNIRYFKMVLKAECLMAKAESNKSFCLIMGDVDHFKHFNDTYGHPVGDLVLKEVAHILKISVRSSDIVARYGGEEMIILLRGASLDHGVSIAEKIRKSVENHSIKDEKNTYRVAISLGVASFQPRDDEKTITKRVDESLYKAKHSGRNRVETVESLNSS